MATSSRPRRNVNRRSMEYHEGLLHEEELAIRRALQASLTASKTKTPETYKNSPPIHHKNNKINKVRRLNNDDNHLTDNKLQNNRKTRPKLISPDSPHATVKKRPKMINDDSPSSRSRSSSAQSSDSVNTTSSNSKMVSSASSQTQQKCTKIVKSPLKSPKKEKLGVRVRKKMMKKKFKAAKHGSDCESTMSGSTVNEVASLKKTRTRKRKRNPTFVQKKFASVTPSPSKMSVSTVEIDSTVPLAKAEDFIDFLCLRGHPQMPKDLEFFNNPNNSPLCDDDFPTSPPSSSLSELPSSPSPSLPTVTSVDSPSCETPTFDPLIGCDDELHAMRMYAGVENKRNAVDEQTSFKQEITVSDLEHEEEPFKNAKPVTPPLSFRVSPRPAPPLPNGNSLSGSKITPSPAPVMTKTSSSTINTDNVFYPTLDSPAFGPPPLMLGQGKATGPGGCCSPPPLLYIPAAAQRVTHLHGPPKLERVNPISDGTTTINNEPPLLERIDQPRPENVNKQSQLNIQNRTSSSSHDGSSIRTAGDRQMNNLKEHLYIDQSSSAVVCTTATNTKTKQSSMEDVSKQTPIDSYTRNTKSCPLHNSSDLSRLEQAKNVLNTNANDPYTSGSPKTRPSSQGANSSLSHVGYNTRSHEVCSVVTQNEMGRIESPDSTISLGTSSLLENLQRAHDRVSGLMSPLETSPSKLQSFTHSGQNTVIHEAVQMNLASTLLRENNQIPNSPRMPPPISEPFTGHTTGNVMPFEPPSREALTPPWSHLHASYDKSPTPPRPYTLSINSSYNPGSQNHVIPRTIPLVPKLPIVPSNKHISVPFNEKLFLHKPGVNQSYSIPSAFVDSSQKSNVGCLPSYQRGVSNSGFGINLSEPYSMDKNYYSTQKANVISSENIPALNSEVCREDSSNGQELQVIDKQPRLANDSRNNSTNVLTSSQNYSKTNSEVKKRRGRPPGSKNKKTIALLDKNNKESPSSADIVTKNESNGAKETEGTKSSKKKKIECPILRPTEEEFKDPMIYLKSIQSTLEKFGICIIDPPDGWKMESHLPGNPRFTTKRQLIHRLQKRWGPNEIKLCCVEKHLQQQQSTFNLSQMPVVGGCDLDLAEVSRVVMEHGGMQKVIDTKRWNKVADLLKIPKSTQDRVGKVQDAYCKYLLSFDILPESEKTSLENEVKREIDEKGEKEEYRSQCTAKGRSFSMGCFQRTARHFQDHFFKTDPSVNDIEREYWKIVQSRDKYVAAHHVKLDTKEHGSCFPTSKSDPYSKNGWNLNVLAHLKGSILKHAGNVQDLTVPWLNIDMLFTTKRWTTSPLQTYLIDYLHSSNDKVWYGVPESDIDKFPHTENENTNDYEDGEFMVSPSNLSRETGLNVTRLEQKQGQFVVVSPKVFHCYVSSGYSVSETVCFAFPDWLLRSSTIDSGVFLNWPGFSYEKLLIKSIDEVCSTGRKNLECLLSELTRIRENEVALRKELKELGVTESTPTSTTSKGIQTIETAEGSVQVNSHCMSCVVCDRLSHLSTVLSEEDSEILCLPDAINYIKNEKSSKSFTIVTNCSLSQLDEAISSATKKLNNL